MAAKRVVKKYAVIFKLYEKSIGVEGVPGTLFLGRKPNERDMATLSRVLELGVNRGFDKGRAYEKNKLFNKFKSIFID